jgi:hypothetical protein
VGRSKVKRVAIVQSNYIPWKGYFDLIAAVDEFILFDDAQYTKNDWRNRNVIKTSQGPAWLTVPVRKRFRQSIHQTEIEGASWAKSHARSLSAHYHRSQHYEEIADLIMPVYQQHHAGLSELNRTFIEAICRFLGIRTKISSSRDFTLTEGKTERLVGLCHNTGADVYVSGPSAKDYLLEECFAEAGVKLEWFDYAGYPEYPQLWGKFVHELSILDLLFNCGHDAPRYMRYVNL